MPAKKLPASRHFERIELATGVHACLHRPGGAGFSNAGIVDLGDLTLVLDAGDSAVAAGELRLVAETWYERPVDALLLTHSHADHWLGARAFGRETRFVASETTQAAVLAQGPEILAELLDADIYPRALAEAEAALLAATDERERASLQHTIDRTRFRLAEREGLVLRYPEEAFAERLALKGGRRAAEFVSYGRGHSADDAVLELAREGIAFVGDIGFFNTQPFMGFCDLELWRDELDRLVEADFEYLVPGHGTLGGRREVAWQLDYFDWIEEAVGAVARAGGSVEQALALELPRPFDGWLMGGLRRWEVNVRFVWGRATGG